MKIARVIDFETTGMPEDAAAEIIEFGRIDVDLSTQELKNPWSALAKPKGDIPPIVKAVHHIIESDVADALSADDLWSAFLDGCEMDDLLVAHNAAFEQHFYDGAGRPWIDTYKVARVVWPDAPTHSNQGLRYWLDLPVDRDCASPPSRSVSDGAKVSKHSSLTWACARLPNSLLSAPTIIWATQNLIADGQLGQNRR